MSQNPTANSSRFLIKKIIPGSKLTGPIGVLIDLDNVLIGNLNQNELSVVLVLQDCLKIGSRDQHIPPPSQFSLKILLKEESSRRHIICSNKIHFPLSSEHILAIYFMKAISSVKEANLVSSDKVIVLTQTNIGTYELLQKALALVEFTSKISTTLHSIDGRDCGSPPERSDCSSSAFVVQKLLENINLNEDVKIEEGEFQNRPLEPAKSPDLIPEILNSVESCLQKAIQEGIKAHRTCMHSMTDRKEPFTDKQLRTFHDQTLQAISKNFVANFEQLSSSYSSLASCINVAKAKLESKVNSQLATYLKRYENSINSLNNKVKNWTFEVERLYDEGMEEFDPKNRSPEEILAKHSELETEALNNFKQKFSQNKIDWQEFWLIEPQLKLKEILEENLDKARKSISTDFGGTLSSLSSPQLVMKSISTIPSSSISTEKSSFNIPTAPPNSYSSFDDYPRMNSIRFSNNEENYLQDQDNYAATSLEDRNSNYNGGNDEADVDQVLEEQQHPSELMMFPDEGPKNTARISQPYVSTECVSEYRTNLTMTEGAISNRQIHVSSSTTTPSSVTQDELSYEQEPRIPVKIEISEAISESEIKSDETSGNTDPPQPEEDSTPTSLQGSDSDISRQIEEASQEIPSKEGDTDSRDSHSPTDNGSLSEAQKASLEEEIEQEHKSAAAEDSQLESSKEEIEDIQTIKESADNERHANESIDGENDETDVDVLEEQNGSGNGSLSEAQKESLKEEIEQESGSEAGEDPQLETSTGENEVAKSIEQSGYNEHANESRDGVNGETDLDYVLEEQNGPNNDSPSEVQPSSVDDDIEQETESAAAEDSQLETSTEETDVAKTTEETEDDMAPENESQSHFTENITPEEAGQTDKSQEDSSPFISDSEVEVPRQNSSSENILQLDVTEEFPQDDDSPGLEDDSPRRDRCYSDDTTVMHGIPEETTNENGAAFPTDSSNNYSEISSGNYEDFTFISLQEVPKDVSVSYDNLASIEEESSLVRIKASEHSSSTHSLPEKIRSIRPKRKSGQNRLIYESSLNIHKL